MTDQPLPPAPLERRIGRTTVVELSGELDIVAAPRLTEVLDRLTAAGRPDVLVDLRPVTFIDCSGLSPLNRARARSQARAGRLALLTKDPRVLRMLRLTGLARAFEVYPGVDEALAPAWPVGAAAS